MAVTTCGYGMGINLSDPKVLETSRKYLKKLQEKGDRPDSINSVKTLISIMEEVQGVNTNNSALSVVNNLSTTTTNNTSNVLALPQGSTTTALSTGDTFTSSQKLLPASSKPYTETVDANGTKHILTNDNRKITVDKYGTMIYEDIDIDGSFEVVTGPESNKIYGTPSKTATPKVDTPEVKPATIANNVTEEAGQKVEKEGAEQVAKEGSVFKRFGDWVNKWAGKTDDLWQKASKEADDAAYKAAEKVAKEAGGEALEKFTKEGASASFTKKATKFVGEVAKTKKGKAGLIAAGAAVVIGGIAALCGGNKNETATTTATTTATSTIPMITQADLAGLNGLNYTV